MSGGEFSNRRIIITGGASGIGQAAAAKLVEGGARVLLFDVDAERLDRSVDTLGSNVSGHVCDVTREDRFEEVFTQVHGDGAVDGLVCCAGMADMPSRAEELSLEHWTRIMESHLNGTFIACRVVGGAMLNDGGGTIVNIASVLSFNSGPVLAYGAAKAAVVNLTSSLAVQWASRKVRVNAVAPGWTDTPFLRPKQRQGQRNLSPILAATPLARLLDAEEIAEVIAFLLSPRSSAIVGTTVVCDGGVIAGAGWPPYGGFSG